MNRAKVWMAVGTAAVTGIVLASCSGESKDQQPAAPPVAAVPSPETVVLRANFSSPTELAWVNSVDSMIDTRHAGANLAWSNVVGKKFRIVKLGCTDKAGKPIPCHLEVFENTPGQYEPERTFEVTPGSRANTYNIDVRTAAGLPGEQTELMICKDVEERSGNDQAIKGECDVYPVRLDEKLNPKHSFCAHTENDENGKLGIWFKFTHDDCTQTSGTIHNGNGHAE